MNAKPAAIRIFDQLTFVLEQLSNTEYSKASNILHNNSIGQHMRHTLEFFTCLLDGLPKGVVNYDQRERDIFLESNTLEALSTIMKLKERINHLDENVTLSLQNGTGEKPSNVQDAVPTNLYRELIYNLEHAIHHMALIKIGLKEIKPALELPENFGVANSTVVYRESQRASV